MMCIGIGAAQETLQNLWGSSEVYDILLAKIDKNNLPKIY